MDDGRRRTVVGAGTRADGGDEPIRSAALFPIPDEIQWRAGQLCRRHHLPRFQPGRQWHNSGDESPISLGSGGEQMECPPRATVTTIPFAAATTTWATHGKTEATTSRGSDTRSVSSPSGSVRPADRSRDRAASPLSKSSAGNPSTIQISLAMPPPAAPLPNKLQ
ncbi:hypothetical protein ACLOJK_039075 [Asimina triloba]